MKRVLFWVVVMFALGEVMYIIVPKLELLSMLLGMLICVGAILCIKRKRAAYIIVSLMSIPGALNVAYCHTSKCKMASGCDVQGSGVYAFGGEGSKVCESESEGSGVPASGSEGIKVCASGSEGIKVCASGRVKYKSGENVVIKTLNRGDEYAGDYEESVTHKLPGGNVEVVSFKGAGGNVEVLSRKVSGGGEEVVSYKVPGGNAEGVSLTVPGGCLVVVRSDGKYKSYENVDVGDYVTVTGCYEAFKHADNPGVTDYADYYRSKGYCYGIQADRVSVIRRDGNLFYIFLDAVKQHGRQCLINICDSEGAALYSGILFGDKADIEPDTKALFRMSGIAHILAISGLHVAVISGIVMFLLRRLKVPVAVATAVSIIVAILYGCIAGLQMATLRAIIMLVVAGVGQRLGQCVDMLTGLAIAIFIMLVRNPYSITDSSLILSASAIFGVCLGTYFIKRSYKKKSFKKLMKKHAVLKFLYESLIISFSINIVMFPVTAYLFYEIPVFNFLINIVVVSLMTYVVIFGFLGVIAGGLYVPLGTMLIKPGVTVLSFFKGLAAIIVKLPCAVINTGKPMLWQLVVYYVLLMLILLVNCKEVKEYIFERLTALGRKRRASYSGFKKFGLFRGDRKSFRRFIVLITWVLSVMMAVFSVVCVVGFKGEMVVFMYVGQGDGIVLRTKGNTVVAIDGGSSSVDADKLALYTIEPVLKALRMAYVDYWVVTHMDDDHINGLVSILDNYDTSGIRIDNIVVASCAGVADAGGVVENCGVADAGGVVENCGVAEARGVVENCGVAEAGGVVDNIGLAGYEKIIRKADECGINIIYMDAGMEICNDKYRLRCVNPCTCHRWEDKNDCSLALSYVSEDMTGLFLGDMSTDAIKHMMSEHRSILESRYTFLKIAHHGSKNSVYMPLYELSPHGYAVISCGKKNRYGHPNTELLDALGKSGMKILRTDKAGAIVLVP